MEKKTLKKTVSILVLLLLLAGVAVAALSGGEKSLKDNAQSTGPVFESLEEVPEEEQDPEAMAKLEEEKPKEWQEGWIRYNGDYYQYKEDIITILFMGIDKFASGPSRDKIYTGGQADMMMLLVLDPVEERIRIIPINRNTMADVDIYDSEGNVTETRQAQLCVQHAVGDGKELSGQRQVNAVSRFMYQLPIHGYIAMNMDGIAPLNDALGGVEVTVPADFSFKGTNFKEGETITLKGKQSYTFISRREQEHGAADRRLDRQRVYVKALITKVMSSIKSNPTYVTTLYNTIADYTVTDITLNEMVYIASKAAAYSYGEGSMVSIEGETVENEEFDEFHVDQEALKKLIIDVFYEKIE